MNMFDEARALSGMIRMRSMTQSAVAEKLGVSQSYIANKLRLLGFSERMQERILEAGVSERHARALLRLPDEGTQRVALAKIVEGRMPVAQSEVLIEQMLLEAEPERLRPAPSDPQDSPAGKIASFEEVLDRAVALLRLSGVSVRKTVEKYEDTLYITLAVR